MLRYGKLFLLLLIILVNGCSYFKDGIVQDRDTDYLKARNIPPLMIPPCLSSSTMQTLYPVPQRDYPECAKQVSLVPPNLC